MLTPERLFRFMIELIFVLLGVLLAWLGLAGPRRSARHRVADSQPSADRVGPARAVQSGPVVAAVAELDARIVPRTSGRPHARDFAGTVFLGWSDARGRRRPARAARHDCRVFDLPSALKEGLRDGESQASPSSRLSFSFASTIIRGTDSPSKVRESVRGRC